MRALPSANPIGEEHLRRLKNRLARHASCGAHKGRVSRFDSAHRAFPNTDSDFRADALGVYPWHRA